MNGWQRVGLLLVLLLVLVWSLVAFGSVDDVPVYSIRDVETTEVITDPGARVGERVVVHGTVTGTDPVVVKNLHGEVDALTVTGLDHGELTDGDAAYIFGTLTGPGALEADRVVVEEPWERTYMYAVSLFGGLVVLGHLVSHWRFDLHGWAFVPRGDRPVPIETDD